MEEELIPFTPDKQIGQIPKEKLGETGFSLPNYLIDPPTKTTKTVEKPKVDVTTDLLSGLGRYKETNPYKPVEIFRNSALEPFINEELSFSPETLATGTLENTAYQSQGYFDRLGKNFKISGANAVSTFVGTMLEIPQIIQNNSASGEEFQMLEPLSKWRNNIQETNTAFKKPSDESQSIGMYLLPSFITKSTESVWGSAIESLGFGLGGIAGTLLTEAAITAATDGIGTIPYLGKKIFDAARFISKGFEAEKIVQGLNTTRNVLTAANSVRALNIASNVSKTLLRSGYGSYVESAFEALEGKEKIAQELVKEYVNANGERPLGKDLEDIKTKATDLSNTRFWANYVGLTITNIPFTKSMFQPFDRVLSLSDEVERLGMRISKESVLEKNTKQLLGDFWVTNRLGKLTKKPAEFLINNVKKADIAWSEGLEEGYQYAVEKGAENYYTHDYNTKHKETFLGALQEGLQVIGTGSKYVASKEGIKSVLAGIVGGGFQTGITSSIKKLAGKDQDSLSKKVGERWVKEGDNYVKKKVTLKDYIESAYKDVESFSDNLVKEAKDPDTYKGTLRDQFNSYQRIGSSTEDMLKAKSEFSYKQSQAVSRFHSILPYVQKGHKDILVDKLKEKTDDEDLITNLVEDVNTVEKYYKKMQQTFVNPFKSGEEHYAYEDLKSVGAYHLYMMEHLTKNKDYLENLYGDSLLSNKKVRNVIDYFLNDEEVTREQRRESLTKLYNKQINELSQDLNLASKGEAILDTASHRKKIKELEKVKDKIEDILDYEIDDDDFRDKVYGLLEDMYKIETGSNLLNPEVKGFENYDDIFSNLLLYDDTLENINKNLDVVKGLLNTKDKLAWLEKYKDVGYQLYQTKSDYEDELTKREIYYKGVQKIQASDLSDKGKKEALDELLKKLNSEETTLNEQVIDDIIKSKKAADELDKDKDKDVKKRINQFDLIKDDNLKSKFLEAYNNKNKSKIILSDDKSTTIYSLNGKLYERVSNYVKNTPEIKTKGDVTKFSNSVTVGNLFDAIAREFFINEDFTEEELNKTLDSHLKKVLSENKSILEQAIFLLKKTKQEILNKHGKDAVIITEEMLFNKDFKNQNFDGVAGTTDMLVLDENGIHIYDFKTQNYNEKNIQENDVISNFDKYYSEKWTKQLSAYSALIGNVVSLSTIVFPINYEKDSFKGELSEKDDFKPVPKKLKTKLDRPVFIELKDQGIEFKEEEEDEDEETDDEIIIPPTPQKRNPVKSGNVGASLKSKLLDNNYLFNKVTKDLSKNNLTDNKEYIDNIVKILSKTTNGSLVGEEKIKFLMSLEWKVESTAVEPKMVPLYDDIGLIRKTAEKVIQGYSNGVPIVTIQSTKGLLVSKQMFAKINKPVVKNQTLLDFVKSIDENEFEQLKPNLISFHQSYSDTLNLLENQQTLFDSFEKAIKNNSIQNVITNNIKSINVIMDDWKTDDKFLFNHMSSFNFVNHNDEIHNNTVVQIVDGEIKTKSEFVEPLLNSNVATNGKLKTKLEDGYYSVITQSIHSGKDYVERKFILSKINVQKNIDEFINEIRSETFDAKEYYSDVVIKLYNGRDYIDLQIAPNKKGVIYFYFYINNERKGFKLESKNDTDIFWNSSKSKKELLNYINNNFPTLNKTFDNISITNKAKNGDNLKNVLLEGKDNFINFGSILIRVEPGKVETFSNKKTESNLTKYKIIKGSYEGDNSTISTLSFVDSNNNEIAFIEGYGSLNPYDLRKNRNISNISDLEFLEALNWDNQNKINQLRENYGKFNINEQLKSVIRNEIFENLNEKDKQIIIDISNQKIMVRGKEKTISKSLLVEKIQLAGYKYILNESDVQEDMYPFRTTLSEEQKKNLNYLIKNCI